MKKEISENRMARTKCRCLTKSDRQSVPFPSGRQPIRFRGCQCRPCSSPYDNISMTSSGPMVPEIYLSSDSEDELEDVFRPSINLFRNLQPSAGVSSQSNQHKPTPDKSNISSSSSTASGALNQPLIPEIDLSSDSEDELEFDVLISKMMVPNKGAFVLPKITESKLDRQLQGKKYFKALYHASQNSNVRERWIMLFYDAYLSFYTFFKKKLSIVVIIFWLYGLASFYSALGIHLLDMLSNTWRLTLRYTLRIILKIDQLATKYLDDRIQKLPDKNRS